MTGPDKPVRLQGCKGRKDPEECKKCPYCLCLPCLTLLRKVSNHLNLVKGAPLRTLHCRLDCMGWVDLVLYLLSDLGPPMMWGRPCWKASEDLT